MSRLLLVRHGESLAQAEGFVGGPRGCKGLSEKGRRQVEALRDRWRHRAPEADVLVSSTLPRAVETAEILNEVLGHPEIVRIEDLCEIRPGESDGMAWAAFEERFRGTPDWEAVHAAVSAKAVITKFASQDGTFDDDIAPVWPGIRVIEVATLAWGYMARRTIPAAQHGLLSAEWMRENVTSVGPLGALYRVWGDGRQMVAGDMTDYFHLSGLSADELRALTARLVAAFPAHPPYGGEFGDDVQPHLTVDAASGTISLATTAELLRDVVPVDVVLDRLQLAWWESGSCHVMEEWSLGQ